MGVIICLKRISILFLISYHTVVYSQFNDTTYYNINYASTGTINRTNDGNSFILNNSFRFSTHKKSFSSNFTTSWIYGESKEDITNNDFTSLADLNLYKTFPHFYYWGLAGYETSHSLNVDHRFQTGVGVGYNIIDREKLVLVISNGILYEKNELRQSDEYGREDYETFRNSFRIKFRWVIKEIVTLEGSDFLQHSLSSKKDYIVKSYTSLSVKIVKWLSFTSSVTYNKMNFTGRENLLITYGLTLEKFF